MVYILFWCRVIGMVVPFGQTNQRWADALVWRAGFDPGWTADGVNYPRGTRILKGTTGGRRAKPNVSVGRAQGAEVVFFDGEGGDSLELPMPITGGQFTALAIGIERNAEGGYGSLLANQRRNDGELSAGFEMRG